MPVNVNLNNDPEYAAATARNEAARASAMAIPVSVSSPGGIDSRARDANGQLTTNQQNSSQYWMNGGYTGVEPTMAVKAAYSDAQFAYNNAVAIAQAAQSALPYTSGYINQLARSPAPNIAPPSDQPNSIQMPDLSAFTGGINSLIKWATDNFFLIVIVIVGVMIMPSLIGMVSGSVRAAGKAAGGK